MRDSKAVVHNGVKPLKIDFDNYSSNKIISDPFTKEEVEGVLVIFNSNEKFLRNKDDVMGGNIDKLISGLSSEIALSLTSGWKNCYFSSFEKYSDYDRGDLPGEFTTLDEDKVYCYGQNKVMLKYIKSCLPLLKSVRFVGIVSSDELKEFQDSIGEENIKMEVDSPFLMVV